MKHNLRTRLLSLLLCVCMMVSLLAHVTPVRSAESDAEGETALSTEVTNPFNSDVSFVVDGEEVSSNSYRIPSMVTLADGTIVAAADIRWNTTYDGGGLDTLVARSTDGGMTWSYTVANYLGDNENTYNSQSTAFIDPCLTVAEDGKTLYMLCDLYPYGVALNGSGQSEPSLDVGFTANGDLKLSNNDHESYDYYLKDGNIYNSSNERVEGYTVDKYFNLYDGNDQIVSNLFFWNSPYKVASTGFLYLISSTNGGEDWSAPTLLNLKTSSEQVCLVAPGNGITTADGTMVFPVYSHNGSGNQYLGFVYSEDNGSTWKRSDNYTGAVWSSESSVVEIGEGTLRFFYRNSTSKLCYVDYDINTNAWGGFVDTGVSTNSNTQLSAIKYSKTVRGQQVVLVSCPTGPNGAGSANSDGSFRTNGKIFVGVVAVDGSMTWHKSIDVSSVEATAQLSNPNYTEEQGFFAYSSLTERADGSIAILYENNQFGWGAGDDFRFTINMKAYSASELGIEFDSDDYSSTLSDGNITVSGAIPTGVSLKLGDVTEENKEAVEKSIIDTTLFDEVISVSGQNIALVIGESENLWQPGAARPVTVTIADVWSPRGKEMPSVEVYHILDDANAISRARANGYLLTSTDSELVELYPDAAALMDGNSVPYVRMSSRDGEVSVLPDGSISFPTDSFSDYYVVLGFTDGLSLSNNGNDTYYVEPGTTLTFNRNVTWTTQGTPPTGITASGSTVTIGSGVPVPSDVTYNVSWQGSSFLGSSTNTATVKIIVSTRNQIVEGALNDEKYPVILSVVQKVSTIPSEPGHTNGTYYQLNSSYVSSQSFSPAEFSSTANGVINPSISDMLTKSIDGSNTIGYADATGVTILRNLNGIDWNRILERAVNQKWKAIDGTTITNDNKSLYKIVPYVIKLMDGSNYSGKGWHIDCAIVLKDNVTLSYDINLDNYQVSGTSKLTLPNTASGIPNPKFNTDVGSIAHGSNNLNVGSTISATYNGEPRTLTFKGWNTSPDGSGTTYVPESNISISEDTVLYAIWEGALVPGELYIYKTVTAEDGAAEPSGATYQFSINFSTAGTYSYTVYNADGSTASSGSVNTQGTIYLANGQYAVFAGIPANTTYTVTETAGSYTTTSEGGSGVIRSGGRAVARFVNHYTYVEPEITINYIAKDGGSVTTSSETVKVNTGNAQGSTANPSDGYQFTGWFRDEECTQPVGSDWVDNNNQLVPKKEGDSYKAATYYAKFAEQEVVINYEVVGPSGCENYCKVDPTSQTVPVISGNPSSTASVEGNVYKFVGWYSDDACTQLVTKECVINPKKVVDLHVKATYYAKFEYNLTSLTIKKTGYDTYKDIDPNQTFIFNVKGEADGVDLTVTIHGDDQITITGLTVGNTYTVTEETDWSWRYDFASWSFVTDGDTDTETTNGATIILGATGNEITFTNTRSNEYWLDGDSYKVNIFSGNK